MCLPAFRRRARAPRRFLGVGVGGVGAYVDGLIAEADRTGDVDAYRDATRLCVVHGRPDDAVRCLERCVRAEHLRGRVGPATSCDLSLLGKLHADAGRYAPARACFLRSVEILVAQSESDERQRTAEDLRRAAECSYVLGDHAAAVDQYAEASRTYRACVTRSTSRVREVICHGASDRCELAAAKLLVATGRARDAAAVAAEAYASVAIGPMVDELIVVHFACCAFARTASEALDVLSGLMPHRPAARYLRAVVRSACVDPPPTDDEWLKVVLDDRDAPTTGCDVGEPSAQSLLIALDRAALRAAVAARTRRPATAP